MTNGDMIRSMNNKELAKYLSNMMNCDECYRVQEETMRDIKVYRMNDCDCVASNLNKEETNDWYNKEYGCENELDEVEELDVNNNFMNYEVESEEAEGKEFLPLNEARNGTYHLHYGSVVKHITFREALERDCIHGEYKEPYIIASTEE